MRPDRGRVDSRTIGIVLTGGASRRMGRNKALLCHEDRPFARIAAELLSLECRSVYLAGGSGADAGSIGWPHIPDDVPGMGPLGGIVSAFQRTEAESLLVLPCDLPRMSHRIIQDLLSPARGIQDVTVVSANGTIQPLVGVYSRNIVPLLRRFLEAGERSVRDFLVQCQNDGKSVCYRKIDDPGMSLTNVNTPSEYSLLQSTRVNGMITQNERNAR